MGIKEFGDFIESDPDLSKVGLAGIDLVKTAWKLNKSQGQVREQKRVDPLREGVGANPLNH